MDKDTFVFFGAIAGLIAGVLSIVDRALSIREKIASSAKRADGAIAQITTGGITSPRPFRVVLPFLLREEILVIVSAGLVLNYVGLAIAVRLKSLFYLDMTGTALVSFLLGPWWGAITGLVSNSFVNWALYPEENAYLIVFPWSLVNMTGGIFWG